jgi:pyocin large subunit-like protein
VLTEEQKKTADHVMAHIMGVGMEMGGGMMGGGMEGMGKMMGH